MIQVKSVFAFNELRNFSYLIYETDSGVAWIIDPYDSESITHEITKLDLNLKGILNTHQHWDHIRGNSELQSFFQCPVLSLQMNGIQLDSERYLQFLATPGHTPDHIAFQLKRFDKSEALFSGDTLFNSGVGNCKNGGDVHFLYMTTKTLMELSDDTILFPGHDFLERNLAFALTLEPSNLEIKEAIREHKSRPGATAFPWSLGREKKVNPFLRLDSKEIQESVLKFTKNKKLKTEKELFIQLRSLRDEW